MIQSWLSAWVVRDFISHSLHSVVAWFAIGDFWLPCSKEKRCYNWPFRRIYIWICSKGFDQRRGFIFSPRKLNPCFWRGKHDLIYYRKGIPVNTILLSPSAHSMADARNNVPCLAHWIFPSDYKITFCFAQTRKYSLTLDNFSLSSLQQVPNLILYPCKCPDVHLQRSLAQFWANKHLSQTAMFCLNS